MLTPKGYLFAGIFCLSFSFSNASERCYAKEGSINIIYGAYTYSSLSRYCYTGQYCCGGEDYTACCNYYTFTDYVVSAGTLAGAIIGGLFGLGFLTCCIVCIICMTRRRRTGRVIINRRNPKVNTVATTAVVAPPPPHTVAQPGSYPTQTGYPQNNPYPQQPGGYNMGYTPDGQFVGGGTQPAPVLQNPQPGQPAPPGFF